MEAYFWGLGFRAWKHIIDTGTYIARANTENYPYVFPNRLELSIAVQTPNAGPQTSTNKQTDKQTNKQTNNQTSKQTNKHTHTISQRYKTSCLGFSSAQNKLNPKPLSSSFLWFIVRILEGNPKKELLRGLLGIPKALFQSAN